MNRKLFLFISLIVLLALVLSASGTALASPSVSSTSPATSPWFVGWADKTTSANVGSYPSIAYSPVDGLPYISYYDSVNGNLMLASPASGGNCGPNNSWWCRVVDGDSSSSGKTNGDVGQFSSIAFWKGVTSWKLGISYHNATSRALKVAVWTQTLLSGSWTISTIASTDSSHSGNDVGAHTSLKFTSGGTPYIAYYSHIYSTGLSNYIGSLYIAQPVASGGTCGVGADVGKWDCDLVDFQTGTGMGQYASLGLGYNNVAYMSYYDASGANLRYAHYAGPGAGNCYAGSDYDCLAIDLIGEVGISSSLTAPRSSTDIPRIAYYDKTNGYLKYAFPSGSGANCGSGAWFCGMVDSIGAGIISHVGISMALDENGSPIIAYENAVDDLAPSRLNIARPAAAVDLLIGNCGTVPPGYLFMYWQCDTVDNAAYGLGYVNVAAYTSVAVSPNGLATIAYLETDDYNTTTYLKIAYQRFQVFLPLIKR